MDSQLSKELQEEEIKLESSPPGEEAVFPMFSEFTWVSGKPSYYYLWTYGLLKLYWHLGWEDAWMRIGTALRESVCRNCWLPRLEQRLASVLGDGGTREDALLPACPSLVAKSGLASTTERVPDMQMVKKGTDSASAPPLGSLILLLVAMSDFWSPPMHAHHSAFPSYFAANTDFLAPPMHCAPFYLVFLRPLLCLAWVPTETQKTLSISPLTPQALGPLVIHLATIPYHNFFIILFALPICPWLRSEPISSELLLYSILAYQSVCRCQ